jgi:hypothetical protein
MTAETASRAVVTHRYAASPERVFFTFTERRKEMGEVRHVGEYLPQFDPRMTIVTAEIRPQGPGCELTLTNDGVPPDYTERNAEGWGRILAGLLPAYEGVHAAGWWCA